jgi:hypothetical protein
MYRMGCKQKGTKKRHSSMGIRRCISPQVGGEAKKTKKDHQTGGHIEQNVCNVIPHRVQAPEIVIHCIA